MLNEKAMNALLSVFKINSSTLIDAISGYSHVDELLRMRLRGKRLWGALSPEKRPILYVLIKLLKPKIAVETGVGAGVSTTVILSALNELNDGFLYSIEVSRYYDENKPVGFIIPEELKGRWVLLIGSSRELLEKTLTRLGSLQFFLHDSDHSYSNVLFELETVWRFMERGVILIDNYRFSNAAVLFAKKVKVPLLELSSEAGGLAMMLKA
ncbi:MAG: class I SAM-dependent methyltransferase [Caldivirga sp.]|uniref:class I SAM-dependent methyltransferase n=1 Tax=Caldivirga sp. TaxID=2080243 RepID=UPI003D0F0698